jgi:hypothetical protein
METTTKKAPRVLLIVAFLLLIAGLALYHLGSQINLGVENGDEMLWTNRPGDKWLYVGGVMMLIAGSLSLAAVKIWWKNRRGVLANSLRGSND